MDIPLVPELYVPTKKQLVVDGPVTDTFCEEVVHAFKFAGFSTALLGFWNIIKPAVSPFSQPSSFGFHVCFFFCLWLLTLRFLVWMRHCSDIREKLKEETVRSWVFNRTDSAGRFLSERRELLVKCREGLNGLLCQERERIEISIHKQEERIQFLVSQLCLIREEWIKLIILDHLLVQSQISRIGISGISEELAKIHQEYNLEVANFQKVLTVRPEQSLISGS